MKDLVVVAYSLIALGFLIMTFTIDWLFIVPAAILSWLGMKRLTG